MAYEFIDLSRDGTIAVLRLNRPDTFNAWNQQMRSELRDAVNDLVSDDQLRVVVVTGTGRAFSAGEDVRGMKSLAEIGTRGFRRVVRDIHNVFDEIEAIEVPVIAAVNGPAIGAGLDLACMCDIRISSDDARFAESFVKMGIVPGDGGAWLLPRVVGLSRASELSFTGRAIDASVALQWNLVSQVVKPDELMPHAMKLADEIASNPPQVTRMTKRLIREGMGMSLSSLLELSAAHQALAHLTADHREAVSAFLDKRRPTFGA